MPKTYFIYPSKDIRQFRPVTDGRLDVVMNKVPFVTRTYAP